ncbi:MAG: hypothetical protein GQ564_15680 [Bacteroidales bacterium]|nr:hypothetical protein [Bacteroidales bacterium]
MKNLLLLIIILNVQYTFGQNVIEVEKPIIPIHHVKIFETLDTSLVKNIEVLEKKLKEANSNFEVYQIAKYLGYFYTINDQKEESIELWNSLNKLGIILPFRMSENPHPQYLSNYLNNDSFMKFIKFNEKLKNEASDSSKVEYFVNLPKDYNPQRKYPLIIVLHGRIGNFYATYTNWKSSVIRDSCISIYAKGKIIVGSFTHSFGSTGIGDIKEIYRQVAQKYPINNEQVILAGQSQGGNLSIKLACDSITASGLLLAFPVKPNDFDFEKAKEIKEKGVRVIMICGEKDYKFFEGQLELARLLDSAHVESRVFKYPELGHRFPDDFSEQIDRGIFYLIKREQ